MGICLCVLFIQFFREFFKQHAQYSIKSPFVLTFCVAVLCSIYKCFGYDVVLWISVIMFVMLTNIANDWRKTEK